MNTSIEKYRIELEKSCSSSDDNLPKIIKEVSSIFKTLESLIHEKDLTNKQRIHLFAAIGYFFIPDDFFPEEELGEIGYIDDIILSITILKEIKDSPNGDDILKRNWKLQMSQEEIFDIELPSLIKAYPKQYITVLDYFGLLPDEFEMDF
jgi:uncharacterized membrane protein YkvA (DUF1232 family)